MPALVMDLGRAQVLVLLTWRSLAARLIPISKQVVASNCGCGSGPLRLSLGRGGPLGELINLAPVAIDEDAGVLSDAPDPHAHAATERGLLALARLS